VHRRPLGRVQHAELDAGRVGHPGHLAAERVDLADELPLGQPSDGRVAAHQRDRVQIHREQQRACAHSGGGQGRLASGVARAHDDDVEVPC